jgi:hypothetical protein
MNLQVRGPAWNAGNLEGDALSPSSQRSGLYSLASGPQMVVSRLNISSIRANSRDQKKADPV